MTHRAWSHAAMAAVAGCAGWFAHGLDEPASAPPPRVVTAAPTGATRSAAAEPRPLIAVSADGRASLHVDDQPLDWVLEQIAARRDAHGAAGRLPDGAPVRPPVVADARDEPSSNRCSDVVPARPVDAAALMQALQQGADAQRLDALLRARSNGVVVPDEQLRRLVETDPSERVRLVALENLLEVQSEASTLRAALESLLGAPYADIRQEAQRRLDEVLEMERMNAQFASGPS